MGRRQELSYFDIPPIPKVIHQIWIPNWAQVPAPIRHTRQLWCELNPTWKYKFWGLSEVEDLLNSSFKFLRNTWKSLDEERIVKKADLARLMILHNDGGLYADMDLKPLLPLRVTSQLTERYIGCSEWTGNCNSSRLCNGFIGAPRKSDAIMRAIKGCHERINHPVLEFLGPKVISSFLLPENIKVLPWQLVLSTQHEVGALCLNLNSRSWGEPEAGNEWYHC